MSYRPITDLWILARPKHRYYGAFPAGYLQRGRHLIPKSATTAPWRISMDYRADRRELRDAPIDDRVMRFERASEPALV